MIGLGTVGIGVLDSVSRNSELINRRSGREIKIGAVCARSRSKDRGIDISEFSWVDDPVEMARRDDIDILLELMGGEDGPARAAIETAIEFGKDVVTANKAMLAVHGQALAEKAESNGVVIRFEAAVAGGIPAVKSLMEGLAANRITRVLGVMNGTCNYILTRMEHEGLDYEQVFAEANALGYLEADPSLDVGGIDAGHKLALLASIAFGTRVSFNDMEIEGIERISIDDIEQARSMGFRVKLLSVARMSDRGLEQRTKPCLVPADSPIGQIDGATNIVVLEGDQAGQLFLRGAGAGRGPTASAVLGDVIDIARGVRYSTFGIPATSLSVANPVQAATTVPYYIRLSLVDRPGVLAKIASALGDAGVSIDRMRQFGHDGKVAPVIIVSHKTSRKNLDDALEGIRNSGVAFENPVAIRIEEV